MTRLNTIDDLKMMVRIAEMYYLDSISQKKIAETLGISPNRVSRYLKNSIKNGFVQFSVNNPFYLQADYSEKIKNKYDLSEVIIVPVSKSNNPNSILNKVGQTAADYLVKNLHPNMSIGLAWGHTALAIAKALPLLSIDNLTLVQMMGGSYKSLEFNDQVFLEFSKKLGADLYRIPVPVILNKAEIRYALLSDHQLQNTLSMFSNLDMMLVTVGLTGKNTILYEEGFLSDDDVINIHDAGGVGNICGRYFDINGKICCDELNKRVIGVDLDVIAKNNNVVMAATGKEKILPIIGALNGGYCDVLIIDELTADLLCQELF